MSVDSNRQINLQFVGDGLNSNDSFPAAENNASPAAQDFLDLVIGTNTVTVPSGAVACTIVPPAGNTNGITVSSFRLHDTDPSSFALDASVTSFDLVAATTTSGVRLIWS